LNLESVLGSSERPARVIVYLRISTDEDNQPTSLRTQRERLAAFVKYQGWKPVVEIVDEITGKTADRPGLKRLLALAKAGQCDTVVVYKIDRLARRLSIFVQIHDLLEAAGVRLVSASELFDTGSAIGKMIMQILAVFAEFEGTMIQERVIRGMESKAAEGYWIKGGTPFGLTKGEDGFLRYVESQKALVIRIFDLFVSSRLGSTEIARRLNDEGLRTRSGARWTASGLLMILKNRVYLGEIFYRGKYHQAPHPAIIRSAVFEKAQVLIAGRRVRQPGTTKSDFILSGMLRCARCGKHYIGVTGGRVRYYQCATNSRDRGGCDRGAVRADLLEDAVLDQLLGIFDDHELVADAIREGERRLAILLPSSNGDLNMIEKELSKTDRAIQNLISALASGTSAADLLLPQIEAHRQQRLQLDVQRERLVAFIEGAAARTPTLQEVQMTRHIIREAILTGEVSQRKAWLRAVVEVIMIHDSTDIRPVYRLRPRLEREVPTGEGQQVPRTQARAGLSL